MFNKLLHLELQLRCKSFVLLFYVSFALTNANVNLLN